LSYGRSRFFTFLFFMLKISRIKPCEYNKNCSTLHHESNKIEFAFFWFFYNFIWIFKDSAIHKYYWSFILCLGPWKKLDPHRYTLGLRIKPWKELGPRNGVPGHGGGAALPILARPAALQAEQERGEECMLTQGPLMLGIWARGHSTTAHGGDRLGQPQQPRFRRDRCTEWTTRDARGMWEVYGPRPTIWWLRTAWTKARRRRRAWQAARW
jgi:hypothetical protein